MATAARQGDTAPADAIVALAERFDPDAMDVPGGRARVAARGDRRAGVRRGDHRAPAAARDADEGAEPDCVLSADAATWRRIAADLRGGMEAFRAGRLRIRGSLHHGVGFLAATSGSDERGRLEFDTVRTRGFGSISMLSAGTGPETIVCLHGLGGTKASFLPTVAALADRYRVVALDLPGFGESDKPIGAPYDAPWFARSVFAAMDALGIERAHIAGNSMGGRVAIEAGLTDRERTGGLLLSPALAWLRRAPGRRSCVRCGPSSAGSSRRRARSWRRWCAAWSPRQRRLDGRGHRRVPARLPHAARARRRSTPRRATSTSTSRTARTGSGPA